MSSYPTIWEASEPETDIRKKAIFGGAEAHISVKWMLKKIKAGAFFLQSRAKLRS